MIFSLQSRVKQFCGSRVIRVSLWYQLADAQHMIESTENLLSIQHVHLHWRHIVFVVDRLVRVHWRSRSRSFQTRIDHVVHGFQNVDLQYHDDLDPCRRRRVQLFDVYLVVVRDWLHLYYDWRHFGAGTCSGWNCERATVLVLYRWSRKILILHNYPCVVVAIVSVCASFLDCRQFSSSQSKIQ